MISPNSVVALALGLVVVAGAGLTASAQPGTGVDCVPPERSLLVLETYEGSIVIELAPEAAPGAVSRLIRLVHGPVFHPELTCDGPIEPEDSKGAGYYDGLSFDLSLRNHYLGTSVRPPARSVLIETEIDAEALGLHERTITSSPEAMDVWQFELMPYQNRIPSDDLLHPSLRSWLQQWSESFTADFLIGVSRKEINEALGYRYTTGLASLPAVRGSVALEPRDARWSSPRLVIALRDFPEWDGRRMVIGRVVAGLELADDFATRPLTPAKATQKRPLVPITIIDARVECRSATTARADEKKEE